MLKSKTPVLAPTPECSSIPAPITIVKKNDHKDAPTVTSLLPSYGLSVAISSKNTSSWHVSPDEFSKIIGSPPSNKKFINMI